MPGPDPASAPHQSYWLAMRGAQQMDLAERYAEAAHLEGLRVLALKGISIADELYDGVENRPMADVDLLVVDTSRFESAVQVAVAMGLVEVGASDHALALKEPSSGAVVELHISLTACPGLFDIDAEGLWGRRKPLMRTALSRLADEDLVVHLALHTAFQHGFAANRYHYGDFIRALDRLNPAVEAITARAREWGALEAVGAMAEGVCRRSALGTVLPAQIQTLQSLCPRSLVRWIGGRAEFPPRLTMAGLAFVRYHLAPAPGRYLARTLWPKGIPGSRLPRPSALGRILALAQFEASVRIRPRSTNS